LLGKFTYRQRRVSLQPRQYAAVNLIKPRRAILRFRRIRHCLSSSLIGICPNSIQFGSSFYVKAYLNVIFAIVFPVSGATVSKIRCAQKGWEKSPGALGCNILLIEFARWSYPTMGTENMP